MINNLKGHSGCILELTTCNNKNCIVKKSNKIEYNKRLEAQYNKQCNFNAVTGGGGGFKAAEVIKSGVDELGLFWFSMAYINGFTLADYMKTIPLADIGGIGKKFLGLIPDTPRYDTNARNVFMAKIKALSKDIAEKTEIIEVSLQKLEDYRWEYMQCSPCHGDLTLENIIISDNTLHLIDFLDSFYDSWQIDIAKVLQDVEIFWHYRNEYIDNNLFIRLLTLKRNIVLKLLALPDGDKLTESIYHTLLLNILRIFPYTKDEHTYNFLQNKLVLLNRKIEKHEWEMRL